ncbi:unnamed protein product [Linum trigynum]|uniref:Uncharacterized protein n=1 Tax=Linum trigynum TaxID=586398 RepID=A0AAV2FEC8_9ROSI
MVHVSEDQVIQFSIDEVKMEGVQQLTKGKSALPSQTNQAQPFAKITSRKASPRGFSINKPPKIQIGGDLPKQYGLCKTEKNRKAEGLEMRSDRECENGPDDTSNSREMETQTAAIFAHTRRRRLISEIDPDDDALDLDLPPVTVAPGKALKGSDQVGGDNDDVAYKVNIFEVSDRGTFLDLGQVPKLGKGPSGPVVKAAHKATKGRLRKARLPMDDSPSPARGPEWAEDLVRVGDINGPAHCSVPMKETVQALVSAKSELEEEEQCFEIKRRPPPSLPKGKNVARNRGRLSQVVAAFEAGLSISHSAPPPQEQEKECAQGRMSQEKLQVEEASHKWPQEDQ